MYGLGQPSRLTLRQNFTSGDTQTTNRSDWNAEAVSNLLGKLATICHADPYSKMTVIPFDYVVDMSRVFSSKRKTEILLSEMVNQDIIQTSDASDIMENETDIIRYMYQTLHLMQKNNTSVQTFIQLIQICEEHSLDTSPLSKDFESWDTVKLDQLASEVEHSPSLENIYSNLAHNFFQVFVTQKHIETLCDTLLDQGLVKPYEISHILTEKKDIRQTIIQMLCELSRTVITPTELGEAIRNCKFKQLSSEPTPIDNSLQTWNRTNAEQLIDKLKNLKDVSKLDINFLENWMTVFETKKQATVLCSELSKQGIMSEADAYNLLNKGSDIVRILIDIQNHIATRSLATIDEIITSVRACLNTPLR